jgi:hypothetical protein
MRNSADLFDHDQASKILRLSNHHTSTHSASLIKTLCERNKGIMTARNHHIDYSILNKTRRYRNMQYAGLILFIPAFLLLGKITHNEILLIIIFIIFAIIMMICGLKIFNTICPRCEKPYFVNNWVKWWVNHCVHCGLYIKAEKG